MQQINPKPRTRKKKKIYMSEETRTSNKVDLSESDVKAGYLIQKPAWVPYRLKAVSSKISKKGDSTNYFLVVVGLEGIEGKTSSEMKDVEFTKMYNSKIKKFMTPFFKAANDGKDLTAGSQDFDDYIDIILEGYTQRGEDQDGNPINDIKDWRPATKIG